MNHILLPGTDIRVSRLSYGTASLHHLHTSNRRQELLSAAIDHGFTHFDTAPYYGFGQAEKEIGKILRTRSHDISIASKVGLYPPGGSASNMSIVWARKLAGKLMRGLSQPLVDWTISKATMSLENTLRALGRDHLDILLLHEPLPMLLDADDFLLWLEKQRESGKIRYWGLAGEMRQFSSWVTDDHPLAQILQVRDSLSISSNKILAEIGRPFQITFGYLSAHPGKLDQRSTTDVLHQSLIRNSTGTIIVSTRQLSRLTELVGAVG